MSHLRTIRTALAMAVAILIAAQAMPQANWAEQARAYLEKTVADEGLVGLTAAVSVDGEMVWSGGAGFADRDAKIAARPEMVHRIASISKPMTAVAVMQLVEQGKLQLTDTLRERIPQWPENSKGWEIQVQHVLSHTSGIRHYIPGQTESTEHYDSLLEVLDLFKDARPPFEPGTRYKYTTFGYVTLGVIIENVSGKDFGQYMRDHVWIPAGMTSTRLEVQGESVANRAKGYSRGADGSVIDAPFTDLSMKYPGGGMISTVEDLLRFVHAFEGGALIKPETSARMLTAYSFPDGTKSNYGSGWGVGMNEELGFIYSHSGGQTGTTTDLVVYRDKGVAVAAISNRDRTNAVANVTRDLSRMAMGLPLEGTETVE